MSPEQIKIQELEQKVKLLTDFMMSFDSVPTVAPQHALTIRRITGLATLAGLSDVSLSSPTNGQVLKYNSSTEKWFNGTDNV
jgi:hypothetical protein